MNPRISGVDTLSINPGLLISTSPFKLNNTISVVNNAIILVDYANQLRASGRDLISTLKEAGETRFRPITFTTATTIGGLLPLTLRGGTMWAPMGWTIIGGLTVSTVLTLVVVPVLYKILSPRLAGERD